MAPTALLRAIPDSFVHALVREGSLLLDPEEARRQHAAYKTSLAAAGYQVEELDADDAFPDCVFIEDTAVIVGSVAVIARPGATSRQGETGPVANRLAESFPLVHIVAPATLDGGDVFIAGDAVYVGVSERTSGAGVEQLGEVASSQGLRLVPVEVRTVLHLKSGVLPIDPETVVVTPGSVDEDALTGLRVIHEVPGEENRFSALPLIDGRVLVTASAPETAARLAELGHRVVSIDVSQLQLADGGLTCLSILFQP